MHTVSTVPESSSDRIARLNRQCEEQGRLLREFSGTIAKLNLKKPSGARNTAARPDRTSKPWNRSMWARRGSPVVVETVPGGFRVVSVHTKTTIVVVGVKEDRIALGADLRRFGWTWSRRRAEYIRRANAGPSPMPQPGRTLNWSSKRAILERIGGRCVMTDAQLGDALDSVARVADSFGSWLSPIMAGLTQADRSELLSECQACAVQDAGRAA